MSSELQRRTPMLTIGEASCAVRDRRLFLASLRRKQQRGEIGTVWVDDNAVRDGRFHITYQRIREPRSRAPWYVAATIGVTAVPVGIAVMVWHARHVLLAFAVVILLAVWLAARSIAGHRPTCVGLHCEGCKG
jgi:hypothetical protein